MSLFDDGKGRKAPGLEAYKRRLLIPEAEQCKPCEGLGTVRWCHSMIGNDWMVCYDCNGSGRKREQHV